MSADSRREAGVADAVEFARRALQAEVEPLRADRAAADARIERLCAERDHYRDKAREAREDANYAQRATDRIVHYRNLAVYLGAKPGDMLDEADRRVCLGGIDADTALMSSPAEAWEAAERAQAALAAAEAREVRLREALRDLYELDEHGAGKQAVVYAARRGMYTSPEEGARGGAIMEAARLVLADAPPHAALHAALRAERANALREAADALAARNDIADAVDGAVPDLWAVLHAADRAGVPMPGHTRGGVVWRMVNAGMAVACDRLRRMADEAEKGTP